jgi:HAD phosphoserine phosphatase-like hydrolase, family IB
MKNIIVYDFDKTIYNGETSTDFMLFFLKRNPKYIIRIFNALYSLVYYKKNLKKSKEIFFKILNGLDIKFLKEEINEFWKVKKDKIFSWVYDEIFENKKIADELILISATPSIFLDGISKELGFDKLLSTEFENLNEVFNSKIIGANCKGEEKVRRLNNYISDYNILKFYSDSMSDKPLFDLAVEKIFVNKGIKEKL